MTPDWICSQIGAREHYAIPRALHHAGHLDMLCTDYWADPLVRKIGAGKLQSLAAKFHPDLRNVPVVSWNSRFLFQQVKSRFRPDKTGAAGRYRQFIEDGRSFACAVREKLKNRPSLSSQTCFFSYDTGALETVELLRERGVKCVVGQMDPNRTEISLVQEEERRWSGWATQPTNVPEEYFQRREKEWVLADRIVVNSEFSRQALIAQGVTAEKLVVIPLSFEAADTASARLVERPAISQRLPLRLLFLGQVLLRKGIQYLVDAAKLLTNSPVHFDIVGPIGISDEAVKSAPSNITFHGRVTRNQAAGWYRNADLFVLPTISDGFALTQLEAMAHGLPVIATRNCGDVVSDGVDGFIVPPRDSAALAESILQYVNDPSLLVSHRKAAVRKAALFDLNRLTRDLLSLERELQSIR